MPRRALITGGLGFLGLSVGRWLAARGTPCVLYDTAAPDDPLPPDVTAVRGDVRDVSALRDAVKTYDVDVVAHSAARLPLGDGDDIWTTNVDGTRAVLDVSRDEGVSRVVFVSSTAVYPVDATRRDEGAPLDGTGPYARSKAAAERLCEEARARGQVVPVVRPAPILGPERLGIFHILFEWVREGRRIPMLGDGSNRYQLVHADDCASAIERLLTAPEGRANATFNLGAARYGTVREDLTDLCRAAGTGARPMGFPARPAEVVLEALYARGLSPLYPWLIRSASRDCAAPVERLRGLGWEPRFSNAGCLIDAYRGHETSRLAPHRGDAHGHRAAWEPGVLRVLRRLM